MHLIDTSTVDESESLSKMIRVDIIFGASSTKYNLLYLKKNPIRYDELLLIEAWHHKYTEPKLVINTYMFVCVGVERERAWKGKDNWATYQSIPNTF